MRLRFDKGRRVLDENDAVVATLDKVSFKEQATVHIGEQAWSYGTAGFVVTGDCDDDPRLRFNAHRAGFRKPDMSVTCGRVAYAVKSLGWMAPGFDVQRRGVAVGTTGTDRRHDNSPCIELPDDVPVEDAVFLLWVSMLMVARSRRGAAAANAST
ncbi:hypothetical protein [Nocardioides sp. Root151]|uniref:hypothetical protein n=1 Tax=Nocardioides sp. Root151 TaxID=1736475 RepID=UPI0007028642|nr:hypothetical protein [Nocardioides sp. Root151]KQZ67261.1 hypothetical protein ASD66_20050 [Nocardioides sp. Root151]